MNASNPRTGRWKNKESDIQPSLASWETTDWDFPEEQGRGEGKGGTAENDYDDEREKTEPRGGREKILKEIYF